MLYLTRSGEVVEIPVGMHGEHETIGGRRVLPRSCFLTQVCVSKKSLASALMITIQMIDSLVGTSGFMTRATHRCAMFSGGDQPRSLYCELPSFAGPRLVTRKFNSILRLRSNLIPIYTSTAPSRRFAGRKVLKLGVIEYAALIEVQVTTARQDFSTTEELLTLSYSLTS
jgi:hypothetical protein